MQNLQCSATCVYVCVFYLSIYLFTFLQQFFFLVLFCYLSLIIFPLIVENQLITELWFCVNCNLLIISFSSQRLHYVFEFDSCVLKTTNNYIAEFNFLIAGETSVMDIWLNYDSVINFFARSGTGLLLGWLQHYRLQWIHLNLIGWNRYSIWHLVLWTYILL